MQIRERILTVREARGQFLLHGMPAKKIFKPTELHESDRAKSARLQREAARAFNGTDPSEQRRIWDQAKANLLQPARPAIPPASSPSASATPSLSAQPQDAKENDSPPLFDIPPPQEEDIRHEVIRLLLAGEANLASLHQHTPQPPRRAVVANGVDAPRRPRFASLADAGRTRALGNNAGLSDGSGGGGGGDGPSSEDGGGDHPDESDASQSDDAAFVSRLNGSFQRIHLDSARNPRDNQRALADRNDDDFLSSPQGIADLSAYALSGKRTYLAGCAASRKDYSSKLYMRSRVLAQYLDWLTVGNLDRLHTAMLREYFSLYVVHEGGSTLEAWKASNQLVDQSCRPPGSASVSSDLQAAVSSVLKQHRGFEALLRPRRSAAPKRPPSSARPLQLAPRARPFQHDRAYDGRKFRYDAYRLDRAWDYQDDGGRRRADHDLSRGGDRRARRPPSRSASRTRQQRRDADASDRDDAQSGRRGGRR